MVLVSASKNRGFVLWGFFFKILQPLMSAKNVINMSLTFKGKYEAVQSYLKKGTTYTKIPSFKNAE